MAGLRDSFGVNVETDEYADTVERARARGMTEFGRAYESGRISDETNPMLADIARLRTSQNQADLARADELQRQVDALKLRQQVYAPTVGRIEDVNGLGSAADWAAYQVGSGIASMQDPLAVSAGLQGAANLTSKGPGILKPISAGLRGAGYAVPYLMGREQLIGENYGQMTEDPTLMQNTTAQQRYDAANLAGSAGAVLDTVVPGYIGGRLAGNGLRQGIARTGMGTRAGLTMGIEGATETGQGELGRMALSDLNPNRDTSGDMSMRLNEFAGGAIGSGPLAAAGAMADAGYRRTGAAAEAIGTKTGETIDLLSQEAGPYVDSAMQKAKDLAGKAGDKIDLSAFKGEDGKVDLGKLVNAAREGAVDLGGQARAAATGIDRDPRVMDLLDFDPADDTKVPQDVALGGPERINQWRNERMALRDEHIFNTLEDLANKGDQRADQLLTAIEEAGGRNDGDGVAMGYLEGRDYLRQSMADEDRRAIQDRAMGLAKLAGKAGAAGAKGVMGLGKAVWDGARGEWTAKKNAQGETDSGFGAILRAELGEGDQGEMAAFVDRLAGRIELGLAKWKSAPTKDGDLQLPYNITALAADMRGTYGERAVQVVEQLAAQQPDMAPGLEALRAEVEAQGTQAGRERAYRARITAANRIMSLVPAAQRGSLGGSSRMRLLDLVERVAEGSAEPGLRKALAEAVGASALAKMLEVANGVTKAKDTQREASTFGDRPSDDGPGLGSGEDSDSAADRTENKGEISDYEKRAAEKRSTQGRAPSLYGFSRVPTLRNSVRDKDIFGPVEKKEKKAPGEKDEPVRRPELFKRGQKLASGANAIEARMAAMERYLGVDKDEIDPSDPYLVSPVSALDIMRRLGMQPAKMMALFRDYMKQEAGAEGMDPALAQKYQELAAQAADAVLDQMDAQKGDEKVRRLTEQQLDKLTKNMQRYFSERFVAVAEQLADRVPEKLTAGEIDDLVKRAQTSLRKIEGKAEKGSDAYKRMVAESNTLFFKMKNPKGGAVAVEVPVRVKDLVRWVREQRNMNEQWEDDPSGWKKDDVFLADVLSGINAMLASGRMADALPYMRNNFGDVESFADGIPGSLRLVTKPMWQITKRREERAEKQAADAKAGNDRSRIVDPEGDENQTALMREYGPDAERESDIDSPEPNIKAGESGLGTAIYDSEFYQMGYNSSWDDYLTDADRRVLRSPPSSPRNAKLRKIAMRIRAELGPDAAREFRKDVQVAGGTAVETNPRARASAKTDDPNATPLDFYPKRKEGEAYDERDDVLYRTKQGGKSAYSPLDYEPPMTATGKLLQDRADRIRRALTGDFVLARELNALGAKATTLKPAQVAEVDRAQRGGVAAIINRLRAALRPTYAKGNETVGGIHYLYPALVALKPENMAAYADAGGSLEWMPEALNDLREQALRIIVDSKLDDAKQLAAIKMMVSDEAAERLNLANFKKYAERNAAPYVSLDELQAMEPRYRDTTRDVSKKPVVPTTRGVGDPKSVTVERTKNKAGLIRANPGELPALGSNRVKVRTNAQPEAAPAAQPATTARRFIVGKGQVPNPAKAIENAETRAMKYLEYLNNPPESYEPKHAVGIRRWANTVLAESTDEDVRSAARLLLKKAEEVIEGDQSLSRIENAGSEVPAQGPKSQSRPGGGRKLNGRSPYLAKDQRKADQATKFIGRGSPASSTAQYARDLKDIANTGQYTASDVVFVSAEGARAGRMDPDFAEIRKATKAGAAFITDDATNRNRPYNVGERQVAEALAEAGYRESSPGRWTPAGAADWSGQGRKLNAQGGAHTITSTVDELSVTGRTQQLGDMVIVEVDEYVEAYGDPSTPPDKVYASGMTSDGDYFSKWYGSVVEAVEALRTLGVTGELQPYEPPSYDRSGFDDFDSMFNAQANGPYSGWKAGTPSTDKEVAEAKTYIDRVLGPQIKVDFEKTMGHSGEWIEASETIKIALNAAAGIMPTAYHEALHAFFSKYVKSNPKVLNVMKALAENEQVLARVYALLDGYPAAQAQLRDGEERLAYIYQFWAAGQLDLPTPQARTWAQKLMKFFRQVLGRVKAEERAGAILEALHEGKLRDPDAAQRVLAELVADKAWTTKARRNFDGLMQGAAALAMPSHSILLESASPTARRLADLFFANPGDESAGGKVGYLNAVRNERTRRTNAIGKAIEGLSEKDQAAVVQYLQQAKDPAQIPYEPHANAVRAIRAELDDFWIYSANAGVDLGRIKDYFPVVWDTEVLIAKREAFIQMLMEHYRPQLEDARASATEKGVHITLEEAASRLHSVIVDRQVFDGKLAVGREDGVLIPFFESANNRTLDWIAPEHREPFLSKSLVGTLSRYFHQGVRAAEYTRRFGADGKRLESRLDDIKDELNEASKTQPGLDTADARAKWAQRQYRDVRNAVAAMEGTLGKDITDTHRRINSWMIVYQNIRLLPLSLFSSFVDPLSMVARGADFKTAGEAFLSGLREVFRGWRDIIAGMPKDRQKDEWEKMAEFVGTTESAIFAHYVAETYSSQYMSPRAKRINDMMFKLNGMEAWNRAMRVGATKGAVQFIIKHKDSPEQHSQRWLKELGLTGEDIVVRDGKLIVDKAELMALGMDAQKAEDISMKNKAAINRWVEGAVLTPNSAQRPAWSSDPRWSFLFHLKQFTYSFHQTILKRVWGEIKHGNLAPAGVMAMFIPTMIAADITKGLIQGGGDLPAYMKGMDAGDWVLRGVERSGVLGYGQIGVDTGADWSSLAGPSVEQVIDGFRQPIDQTIVRALPANPLYREAFR